MIKITDYQPRTNKEIITDFDDLLDAIKDRITNQNPAIVTIDGFDGSGKTTLAKKIGKALGGKVISFDDFLGEPQDRYVGALDDCELRTVIARRQLKLGADEHYN